MSCHLLEKKNALECNCNMVRYFKAVSILLWFMAMIWFQTTPSRVVNLERRKGFSTLAELSINLYLHCGRHRRRCRCLAHSQRPMLRPCKPNTMLKIPKNLYIVVIGKSALNGSWLSYMCSVWYEYYNRISFVSFLPNYLQLKLKIKGINRWQWFLFEV